MMACNGVETCGDAGTCVAGTDPCTNPDPDHCVATCTEGAEGAECGVEAADADEDGHGDPECAEAPGDDCDDTLDTVNPSADEICDGLDNDCNDLTDLDDGLTLYGTPEITSTVYFVDLAFDETEEVYGIAYSGTTRNFRSYNTDQSVRSGPVTFPGVITGGDVKLEWGGAQFAGFYIDDNGFLRLHRVNADGVVQSQQSVINTGGNPNEFGMNPLAAGGWGVTWAASATSFNVRLFDSAGAALGNVVNFTSTAQRNDPRLAQNGDTYALLWNEAGTVTATFYDDQFNVVTSSTVTDSPGGVIYGTAGVEAIGTGYAVAYTEDGAQDRVRYMEFETDGSVRCGPITLDDTSQPYFNAMDAHETRAVVYLDRGPDHVLHRIDENCMPVDDGRVIETVPFYSEISDVDINATGIGVVTQIFDDGGANPRMSFRAFGPNLCDAPL
jgi:hypothetical protein